MRSRIDPDRLQTMRTSSSPTLSPAIDRTACSPRRARRQAALATVLTLSIFAVLTACGSSDADGGDSTEDADTSVARDDTIAGEASEDEAPDEETTDDAAPSATPSAEDVAACLDDAGYATVSNTEQLSEQQIADLETAFGQVDGLTFDAATTEFAGGIQFFTTADEAEDRADALADAAVELRPIGPVLISVGAGTNYEDAVAAAESCIT